MGQIPAYQHNLQVMARQAQLASTSAFVRGRACFQHTSHINRTGASTDKRGLPQWHDCGWRWKPWVALQMRAIARSVETESDWNRCWIRDNVRYGCMIYRLFIIMTSTYVILWVFGRKLSLNVYILSQNTNIYSKSIHQDSVWLIPWRNNLRTQKQSSRSTYFLKKIT